MGQGFFLNSDLKRTTMVDYTFLKAIKSLLAVVKATPGYIDYKVTIEDVSRGVKVLVQSSKNETLYGRVLPYDCLENQYHSYLNIEDCVYILVNCFNNLGYEPSSIEILTEGFTIKVVKLDGNRITPSKIYSI